MKEGLDVTTDKLVSRILPLITRRKFVKSAAATALTASGLAAIPVRAESLPRVEEHGAMAKALSYVHDAQTVDSAKRPSHQYCSNCVLFAGGADDEWAGCGIFPGKLVANRGWCSAWAAKPEN